MKKEELLKQFDEELLDKLFGFCYARTKDSIEAEELCSDIVFALINTAHAEGEIANLYSFIWRVARNVYADFTDNRKKHEERHYAGNADEILQCIPDKTEEENDTELLSSVYRRIAFLTKAYREVIIRYYLDGISVTEIAKEQNIGEGTVRQRLFSGRQKIKREVEEMAETCKKPLALDKIDYVIWGTGNPFWGDPRNVCTKMLSKHIVWCCHQKAKNASEIAEELNVPTVYVEEELEILTNGENGSYGLLRKAENGKYQINFILLDVETFEKATEIYTEQLPKICDTLLDYIDEHKQEYLSFPYLNKKVNLNLILWQQIFRMAYTFSNRVEEILATEYFPQYKKSDRPFSVFGRVYDGKLYGDGWDGVDAENVCGYSKIHLNNIYITRIKPHFHCGLNISTDPQIQLALRSIHGLDVSTLSDSEKEHAAKAIECGYLYRDGDILYTKILVCSTEDSKHLFEITDGLGKGFFEEEAKIVAKKLSALIKKTVPDYLLGDWEFANRLANMPVLDSVVEALIEKGILTPPENGIGAEGCWMSVLK